MKKLTRKTIEKTIDYFMSNIQLYFDLPNESQKDVVKRDGDFLIANELTQKYRHDNEKGYVNVDVSYNFDNGIWAVNGYQETTLEKAYVKYLNSLEEKLEKKIDTYEKRCSANFDAFNDLDDKCEKLKDDLKRFDITKIIYNKEKSTTVVWFYNGLGVKPEKVIVHRRKGTKDDIYTAVAYAIAKRKYKCNSTFQKMVDTKLERVK